MKLLICTQIVDRRDPILGFMHAWIAQCAREWESVEVVCLKAGEYAFPHNVHVHSLGKEKGVGRVRRLLRVVRLMYRLNAKYDQVLVHMNPEYVVLFGLWWRSLGKRVGLWYAHGSVTMRLRIAHLLTHVVFTSTPQGFRIPSKKVACVGQGIDCSLFTLTDHDFADPLRLTTVGRVSRAKRLEVLLVAVQTLVTKGVRSVFTIVGVPLTQDDRRYHEELLEWVAKRGLHDVIIFAGARAQQDLPAHLQASDIVIHAGATGSLDKALLEPLACGVPTLSSNDAYPEVLGSLTEVFTYPAGDSTALCERIARVRTWKGEELARVRRELRARIEGVHDIQGLISRIKQGY